MQLDLFGGEAAAPIPEGGPENLVPHIMDLPFGPVTAIEAQADQMIFDGDLSHIITRDTYNSMVRSGRLSKLIEEVLTDDAVHIGGLDQTRTTLRANYIPMIVDKLNGMTYKDIAAKYGMVVSNVYRALARPAVRKFTARLLGEYAASVGDVGERIKMHATEAVDTLVDVMRAGKDQDRIKSAFGLLRMGGYDNHVTSTNVTINDQPLDSSVIENTNKLLEALRESATARTRGHDSFIEQSRNHRDAQEIGVVEAPIGLKKVANGAG